MKHLVLFLFTLNMLLAKDYAVQVLAVKNPDSISSYFAKVAKRLESNSIKMNTIEEETKGYDVALKKVLFQKFEDKKSAMKFCKVAREKLFGDAFVREIKSLPKSVVAKQRLRKTFKRKSVKVKKYVSAREKRKLKRMKEIAEAIAFYKNSSGIQYTCSSSF